MLLTADDHPSSLRSGGCSPLNTKSLGGRRDEGPDGWTVMSFPLPQGVTVNRIVE